MQPRADAVREPASTARATATRTANAGGAAGSRCAASLTWNAIRAPRRLARPRVARSARGSCAVACATPCARTSSVRTCRRAALRMPAAAAHTRVRRGTARSARGKRGGCRGVALATRAVCRARFASARRIIAAQPPRSGLRACSSTEIRGLGAKSPTNSRRKSRRISALARRIGSGRRRAARAGWHRSICKLFLVKNRD